MMMADDAVMTDILQFCETSLIDETMEEYVYHEYHHITGTNPNSDGHIRNSIESQDVVTHPSQCYLIFEGRLATADVLLTTMQMRLF